jgi:hypothetical protein
MIALIAALLGMFSKRKEIDVPFFWDSGNNFQRILADTFNSLVDTPHPNYKILVVVDWRTQREYDGGHIKRAIRCHPFECHATSLYDDIYDPDTLSSGQRTPNTVMRVSFMNTPKKLLSKAFMPYSVKTS